MRPTREMRPRAILQHGLGGSISGDTTTTIEDVLDFLDWHNVQDCGATGDGVTDDTAAIQDCIDACYAAGGGTVYFPAGVYIVGGALQDTGAFNGQILLPDVDLTTDEQVTIRFLGANQPPRAIHGPGPMPEIYSVIRSTLTGATGTASVFSGGNGPYTTHQNNLQVVWEHLILLVPDDPTLTGLNIETCQGGMVRDNWFANHGLWTTATVTEPTHSNSYAYKLPGKRNSWYTVVEGNGVAGFYNGWQQGELTIAQGVGAALCKVAVVFPEVEHLSLIKNMQVTACTTVMKATGLHYCDVLAYDFETTTGPAWSDIVYDLDDASNYLHGHTRYTGYPEPPTHTFTKNGGTNFSSGVMGPGTAYGPAGGDLSGEYPNPSVVNDSHTHTSATAPGGAGHGKLLLESGHAVPFVFDDILQSSDGEDVLYSS